jgi:cysteine desulfurase
VTRRSIYLDYNATTPLCSPALAAMLPYLENHFGNPSSVHAFGRETRAALDNARDELAEILGTKPHELIFTSGGTESNNLAVLGLARARGDRGKHLISCRTEHHAVLNAFEHLEKQGFEVTWLRVSADGLVDLAHLENSIRSDTTLVSIMAANNETGVTQSLKSISEICRARGVLLHSDMVQSFGKMETDLVLVDAASFAAHKFYGPKGAGLLFLRSGITIDPMMFGGAHENQRRAGTENVAAISGMAPAARLAMAGLAEEERREAKLRDQLWQGLSRIWPGVEQNGAADARLANTLNVSFTGIDSETMLMALDLEGVSASSGSACMVGSVVASHVLLAMGLPINRASSAVRFSLGRQTTAVEIEDTLAAVRALSDRFLTTETSLDANLPEAARAQV